jgi:hypothetical protein
MQEQTARAIEAKLNKFCLIGEWTNLFYPTFSKH